MARRNKNVIDVDASRKFLFQVYGMKTKAVTYYELMIIQEEFKGKFHWYHTTGKLQCEMKMKIHGETYIDYVTLKNCFEDEDVAIAIGKFVEKETKKRPWLYWDKAPAREHRASLTNLLNKINHA